MRMKVRVADLAMGMHVCGLDRPWLETPLGVDPFIIDSDDRLSQLREHCEYVYVEAPDRNPSHGRPSAEEARVGIDRPELELEMLRHFMQPDSSRLRYPDRSSLEQELPHARSAYAQAYTATSRAMTAARRGRAVDIDGLYDALTEIRDGIVRNPDPMLWMALVRNGPDQLAVHGVRVAILTLAFGRHLGMEVSELEALALGALLHDIGMTRLAPAVVAGSGGGEHEQKLRMRHVDYGLSILAGVRNVPAAAEEFVRQHHEFLDGNGYPRGLSGSDISRYGRIAAIVHTYEQLTCWHNPGGALPGHLALKLLYRDRRTRFDRKLVEEFVRCIGIYPLGSVVELLSGETGIVLAMNRARPLRPRVTLMELNNHAPAPVQAARDLETLLKVPSKECEIARLADETLHEQVRPLDYLPITP
jgi:HD-GYP domain-containing protein (c-di-GMP phosphodiesterase class II)